MTNNNMTPVIGNPGTGGQATGNLAIQSNPLKTREDLLAALDQLTEPLRPLYSRGSARLEIGITGASYPAATAGMEGFSRVLWGMIPLLAGGRKVGYGPLYWTASVTAPIRHMRSIGAM